MATRSLNVQITGDTRSFNRALDQTESRTRRWGSSVAKGFGIAGAAAGAGLAAGLTKAAKAAIEAEKSQARLETQLKAVGISFRAHRTEIDRVIQSHSTLSGLDDEDLQDAFTNIVRVTGDVSQSLRLTGLAADFARAKHMDVAKAGELVGKVAGGNTGILSRYGITLKDGATASEALATLQRKFAGQAEAYGKTTQGALDRAGVASENLGEIVGAKLTPLLAKGATALVNLVDSAGKLGGPIRTATGAVRNAYDSVRRAVTRFAHDNREEIQAVIQAARNLGRFFKAIFEGVIVPTVRAVLPPIKSALEGTVRVIRGVVRVVTGIINGDWKRAWQGLKDIVSGVLKALSNVVEAAGKLVVTAVVGLGKEIVKALIRGLSGLANAVKNAIVSGVKKGVGAAKSVVGDVIDFLNPFGDGVGRLARSIGEGVGKQVSRFVGPSSPGAPLLGADPDLAPFAAMAAGNGLTVTSGLRPGAITSSGNPSYHSSGDAIDVSGSPGGMMAFFRRMRNVFGSRLRELIYTPGGVGIKDGRPYRYSGQVAADHFDHVHVAYTGPFGDGIGRRIGDGLGFLESASRRVAQVAFRAARQFGATPRELLALFEAGIVESNLTHLRGGDRDSTGFLQQRPSMGWGPVGESVRTDTLQFLRAARRNRGVGGGAGELAQSVQRSAFPGRYAEQRDRALRIINALRPDRSAAGGGGGRGGGGRSGGGGGGRAASAGGSDTPRWLRNPQGFEQIYEAELAKAGLTPDTADDISALEALETLQAEILRKAQKRGRFDLVSQYAGSLQSTRERLTDLRAGPAAGGEDPNQALIDALAVQTEQLRLSNELNGQLKANQETIIRLTQRQGQEVLAAVIAAVNGSIGGRVGLGLQSPGFAGAGVARY